MYVHTHTLNTTKSTAARNCCQYRQGNQHRYCTHAIAQTSHTCNQHRHHTHATAHSHTTKYRYVRFLIRPAAASPLSYSDPAQQPCPQSQHHPHHCDDHAVWGLPPMLHTDVSNHQIQTRINYAVKAIIEKNIHLQANRHRFGATAKLFYRIHR